jgi:hypothetical protein
MSICFLSSFSDVVLMGEGGGVSRFAEEGTRIPTSPSPEVSSRCLAPQGHMFPIAHGSSLYVAWAEESCVSDPLVGGVVREASLRPVSAFRC